MSICGTEQDIYLIVLKESAVWTVMLNFIWLLGDLCEMCIIILPQKKPNVANPDRNNNCLCSDLVWLVT